MKNIWRKMRDCWLDFWEDDELDMDKKHLSQHDKRSLLYGGFMIGIATFGLFSIGIIAGNIWTNHQNQKDMEEFLGTVVTYMATATDDEYEEIAQTIRHDLVYSQYGQDVENLIRYIPNTADGCCLERELPERINLVFLNTGAAYGLEIFDNTEPIESQREGGSTMITSGYDEISEAHLSMRSTRRYFSRKQRRNSNRNTRRLPGMRKPPPTLPSTRTIRTAPKRNCKRSRKRFWKKSQS